MGTRLKPKHNRLWVILHSIRFRLTLWTVAILAVILVVFSVFIYYRQVQVLQSDVHNRLEVAAQDVVLYYRMSGVLSPDRDNPSAVVPLQPPRALLGSDQTLALLGRDGTILGTSGSITTQQISQLTASWQQLAGTRSPLPAEEILTQAGGQNGHTLYAYLITPFVIDRQLGGMLIVGEPVDPVGQLPRLLITLLLGSLATLAFALVGGFWLASRAMAPVRVITRAARGISETDLHQRLNLDTQDELGELADTFDAMLERLQAAFDRQRQFTADASHELRTPLTIVGLEAEHALARARSPEEYERALQVILSENEFMSRLVNDLLTLARMDAGQTQLRLEPLDLSDITLDVVDRLAPLAKRAGVAILTDELPEVPVQGDRVYLTQMLTNLVENAIKYTGGKGQQVRVSTGLSTEGRKTCGWVRVADDGPGIPPEELPHLFDRFFRVDKARARSQEPGVANEAEQAPEGSGLGLSIVQWIAKAHHGKVTVSSHPGQGAEFTVELPAAAPEAGKKISENNGVGEKDFQ